MDTGTTAFMLCCIIGLTLMIPGLALFYGGMVSVKSSTNMMMMTFGAVALVGVLWVLFGFSMAFGTSYGDLGLLGSITEFAVTATTVSGSSGSLEKIFTWNERMPRPLGVMRTGMLRRLVAPPASSPCTGS